MRGWRALFSRRRLDADMDEELRLHVELATEAHRASGLPADHARRAALRRFGSVESVKEASRAQRPGAWMGDLLRDVRFAGRSLRRSPGFASIGILTIALGIGASAALFSLVDALLLRPLPFARPDELMVLRHPLKSDALGPLSVSDYFDIRAQTRTLPAMAAFKQARFVVADASPEVLEGMAVSAEFFGVLGVRPTLGRDFIPGEDEPGRPRVTILSHDLWERRFGGDPAVLGKALRFDGATLIAVGIAPRGFRFPVGAAPSVHGVARFADLWVPLNDAMDVEARKWRGMRYLGVVGRRAPGASSADVQAEVATVAERLARQHPRDHEQGRRLRAIALREDWFGGAGRTLQLLQVAVAFVLLIGCANVAHLQLARAAARRHELAVRTALGAGRGRLARQLLAESLTLAGAGGIGGLLIAKLGLGALASLVPDDVPQFSEVSITGRVLAWAAILVLATAAAAGAWPALAGSRQGGRPGRQVRGTLVVGQIALALPLLTGALLVARGLANVLSSDLAFEARGLLTARINVPVDRYAGAEARRALYEALEARLQALPGVQAATVAAGLPYANWGGSWKIAPVDEAPFFAGAGNVRGGYFATMGIPLRAGRTFDAADERSDSAHVGIVNETLARRLWPGESAIGRRLRFGHWPGELSVVGVVGDTRRLGRAAEPEAYMPLGGQPPQVFVAVRSARGEAVSATTLRSALHDVDATLPLTEVRTMEEAIGESLAQRRLALLVLGIFAVFALVLTAAGVYGVTSYVVIQRTRELATRAALGARPGQIVGLVLREAWSLSAIGLLLGIAAALGARRLLAAAVPEAASGDLMTYAAPPVAILVVALLAAYLPARRAARLDPMGALRHE